MTQRKKPEDKQKVGRKSRFKAEYIELAYNYSLLGATDVDMAAFFGVSEKTFNTWKKYHPEFLQSLKKGKNIADAEVANKLFHRAKGYSHPDVIVSNYKGEIILTEVTKHYPPETTAAIFWLKNRQPELWRDKVVNELQGKDGTDLNPTVIILPANNRENKTEGDE